VAYNAYFRKFKVVVDPLNIIFSNFSKMFHLIMLFTIQWYKIGVTELVFGLLALKTTIKGVSNRLYCWYGILLYGSDGNNLFTNDWAFVWNHCCRIILQSVLVLIHQSISDGKSWKLLLATLIDTISHFRVTLCLCFKTSLNAKPFIWIEKKFDLHKNEPVGGTHFHMNGFARRLGLTEAKGNSEWSIAVGGNCYR